MKIVRFTAMWCSSCLIMKKRWKKVLPDFDVELIDFDYDEDVIERDKYQVGNILPVLIVIDESNQEVARIVGEMKEKVLEESLRKVIL
ncbi:MAG: TlpA family protein disulfide reductase [Candidatus Izemoplasmatales bacterium]